MRCTSATNTGGMREEKRERGRERDACTQRDIEDSPPRVRERAQHVFPLSHSFRTAECSRSNASVTFVVTARSSFTASPSSSRGRGGGGGPLIYFVPQ